MAFQAHLASNIDLQSGEQRCRMDSWDGRVRWASAAANKKTVGHPLERTSVAEKGTST